MAYRYRGRGQFTAPTTRSGKSFVYTGRSVRIQEGPFRLTWNGPQFEAMISNALQQAFANLSDDALAYMRSIVPVDTGQLQDSCYVAVTAEGGRLRIQIGATMFYAIYVELGTSSRGAQPFIRPTFDYIRAKLPGVVRDEVRSRGNRIS